MKKIIFFIIVFFSHNAFSIPNKYKTYEKQFIYEFIKIKDNKEALMGYISMFRDNAIRNKSAQKIFIFYNEAIYFLSIFDLENTTNEIDIFLVNSIDTINTYTKETYNMCKNIGKKSYYNYYPSIPN